MDETINAFRQAVQFSTPISANIFNHEDRKVFSVTTRWSQKNVERKVKMSSNMFQTIDFETKKVLTLGCSETSGQLISSYSPSSLLQAVLREVPASGKTPKKQYLEVWRENLMFKQFDLQCLDIHGDVYTGSEFSCFEWSESEEQILFLAEKKKPKTESFLSNKPQADSKNNVSKGNEYLFSQDWGEQLVGKCKSVLVVADLAKDDVRLVEVKNDEEYFFASGLWAPGGGVIAVAYVVEPRRLGKVYCTSRASYIVHISPEGDLTKLSDEGKSVFGPMLSPDNCKLIWFQRDASGPHHSCIALVKYDWNKKEQSIVVDIVLNESKCTDGQSFYGLYNHMKPKNSWLPDSRFVVISSPQRASVKTYAIDTELCSVTEIAGAPNEEFSQGVLNVWRDYVICWKSSLKYLPGVYIAKIDPTHLENVDWIALVPCKAIEERYSINILRLKGDNKEDAESLVLNYTAIYFGPVDRDKVPLIVWSHGGPQSSFTNAFDLTAYFFAKLGFGVLMVNYRGSIGAGKASVDYLLGKISCSDVSDTHLACRYVLKTFTNVDANKCFLFGGSHGGFISLHLAGQHPDEYHSVAARNPVVDLTQMSSSDIPDWLFVESGLNYSPLAKISTEEFDKLRKASPQFYVDKVKIPILLLIGSRDLRVPAYHGINYYYALKESGKVKTKLLLYEDNHLLGLSETDFLINTIIWFLESLPSNQLDSS